MTDEQKRLNRFEAQLPVAIKRGWKEAFRIHAAPALVAVWETPVAAAIAVAVKQLAKEVFEEEHDRP